MTKERKPTPEEIALFRGTLHDVVALTPARGGAGSGGTGGESLADLLGESVTPHQPKIDQHLLAPPTPSLRPGTRVAQVPASPTGSKKGPLQVDDVAGVDRKTTERFRRGRMPIEAVLDLHGMTQTEAEPALAGFLSRCQVRGFRCVMVVTGKGKRSAHEDGGDYLTGRYGILRQALPQWLNSASNRDRVLAVHTAQRHHGGGGAFYILLKRQKML